MNKLNDIAVIGGGSWGTALVKIFLENTEKLNWFIRDSDLIKNIQLKKRNTKYLRHVQLNIKKITLYSEIEKIIDNSDLLVIATPSPFIHKTFKDFKEKLKGKYIISASKGVIPISQLVISEHFNKEFNVPYEKIGIISGPCHAEEVAQEKLSYLTVGTNTMNLGKFVSEKLSTNYIKTSFSDDLIGIEYSATIKNVYSLLVGICHGLGYGDNFLSVLISHCAKELRLFITTIKNKTNRDLNHSAYFGDLLVTTYSTFSRNRTFGNMLGKGYSVKSAMSEMSMIVEGYYAAKNAYEIAKKLNIECIYINATYTILYELANPKKTIMDLANKLY